MTRRRRIISGLLRWGFVVAVVVFAIVGFRGEWPSIAASVTSTPIGALALAVALTLIGTIASVPIWRGLLASLGHDVDWVPASRILLVGQLGKYIPGSVWSIGAQARLGLPFGVPVRSSLSASVAYIGYHLAGAVAVAAIGTLSGWISLPVPAWVVVVALVGAVVVVAPPVSRRIVGAFARVPCRVSWPAAALALALSAVSWTCWGAAIAVLASSSVPLGDIGAHLATAVAAYALAYAAGLVVILAPAGFGVREGVLVALLEPAFGLAGAAAVAVLARLVSTLSDFALALGSQLWDRSRARIAESPPGSDS